MAGISMRELADLLGVSTASVSVALRGKPGISEETRKRILEEAHKHGYDMGRLSAPDCKGLVEIIDLTYRGNPNAPEDFLYYNQFLEYASRELTGQGYQVSGPFSPSEPGFLSRPPADGGIVLGSSASTEQLAQYQALEIPFVVTGISPEFFPANTVSHDNYSGIRTAVLYLKEMGHSCIGYLRSLQMTPGQEREQAWRYEISRQGLVPGEFLDLSEGTGLADPESILKYFHVWLEHNVPKATAFLCDSDSLAAAFMRALRDRGYIPGRDISVIGFDDMPFSALLEPPLTTIRTSEPELALASVQLLLHCMKHPGHPHWHIRIETSLVGRNTCQKPTECNRPPTDPLKI